MDLDFSLENGVYIARSKGRFAARLRIKDPENYIAILYTDPAFRQHGVALTLIRSVVQQRGAKFNRTPASLKTNIVRDLGLHHPDLFVVA